MSPGALPQFARVATNKPNLCIQFSYWSQLPQLISPHIISPRFFLLSKNLDDLPHGWCIQRDPRAGGASAWTVEPRSTTTQSLSLSIDTPPEVARSQKPEVTPKPVIVRQLFVLAPYTQIRTGEGSLFLPLVESPEEPDNRPMVAVHHPLHTGNGNGNLDDVTPGARVLIVLLPFINPKCISSISICCRILYSKILSTTFIACSNNLIPL